MVFQNIFVGSRLRAAKSKGMNLRCGGLQIERFDALSGRKPALEVANVVAVEQGATHLKEGIRYAYGELIAGRLPTHSCWRTRFGRRGSVAYAET